MSKELVSNTNDFGAVISIIENAKGRALKAVNTELIHMYWDVGEYLSQMTGDGSLSSFVRTGNRPLSFVF